MEHTNNLRSWNSESFMLLHWMSEHGTSATPPTFSYKIISSHNDALSRQLQEAVMIRARGDMNRKYEFASNELVRLESRNYSWDERKKDKAKQFEDARLKSCIDSFIKVMKCVHTCDNKRKNVTDKLCSRSISSQTKRRKMTTSTPQAFRVQPSLDLEHSPVAFDHMMERSGEGSSMASVDRCSDSDSPTLRKGMNMLKMTPPKDESRIVEKAKVSVTANEMFDSEASFRARTSCS